MSFIILATLSWSATPTTNPSALRRDQLSRKPTLSIIDVRSPDDYAKSHIQGAHNIPAQSLPNAQLPKDSQIVIYCGDPACPLGQFAADQLKLSGYTNISVLDGGLSDWQKKGYPTQAGFPKPLTRSHPTMTAKDARRKLDSGLVIPVDTRPSKEFVAGRLPLAQNLPLESLDTAMSRLPKDKELLVYDRQASRSRQAQERLTDAGFKVTELSGGFAGWVKRKFPVEVK